MSKALDAKIAKLQSRILDKIDLHLEQKNMTSSDVEYVERFAVIFQMLDNRSSFEDNRNPFEVFLEKKQDSDHGSQEKT